MTTPSLKRLRESQRVLVRQTDTGIALNAPGTVDRMCTDGSAWITLDERSKVPGAHPFPAGDPREARVRANPEDCEAARGTGKERRAADRLAERPAVTPATWGRDHWSTLAYIETRIVDHSGVPSREHMRCDPKRHPLLAHDGSRGGSPSPTRLTGGKGSTATFVRPCGCPIPSRGVEQKPGPCGVCGGHVAWSTVPALPQGEP